MPARLLTLFGLQRMNFDQQEVNAPNTAIPLTWPSSDSSFHSDIYHQPPTSATSHHVDLHQQPSSSSNVHGAFSSSPLPQGHLSSSTSTSSLHGAGFDDLSLAALAQASHAANPNHAMEPPYRHQYAFPSGLTEASSAFYGSAMSSSYSQEGNDRFRFSQSSSTSKRTDSGLTINSAASAPELGESGSPGSRGSQPPDGTGELSPVWITAIAVPLTHVIERGGQHASAAISFPIYLCIWPTAVGDS